MAPTDPIRLPLRWEFIPVEDKPGISIRWKWRATTQSGELAMQSLHSFETRTACEADAKVNGYSGTYTR
jgi:hypothetical protein